MEEPYINTDLIKVYNCDCTYGLKTFVPDKSIDIIITSPPYNLGIKYDFYDDKRNREYYLEWIGGVGKELYRVLKDDGSFFFNVGGKPTDPFFPLEIANKIKQIFTCQCIVTWVKSIAIPEENVAVGHYKPINSKRFLNDCFEFIFHFTKCGDISLDRLSIGVEHKDKSNVKRWGGKDKRCRGNVWFIPYDTIQTHRPHPTMFPKKLPEMCMKLHGLDRIQTVLDPFSGAGTTGIVAKSFGKKFVGFELSTNYIDLMKEQL
jgi:site-specific DNA-methyltransferase (adenine-specific)